MSGARDPMGRPILSPKIDLGQTYERDVRFIDDGQVTTWDGRPVYLRDLIKRRWGWPKKAAIAAASFLKSQDGTARLWVANPERTQQQQLLFAAIPSLLDWLCAGLANGSSKEAEDCYHEIVGVNVSFTHAISDDGLIRDVTGALARRLGCTPEDVREATSYNTGGPVVLMRVDTDRFGHEGDRDGCMGCSAVTGHFNGCPVGSR